MEQCLVTIVVPIYKVEKYLDKCIESLVGQTYRNLEIILVDDCSPDRCPQMCDDWSKRDGRIKVIHKPQNEGLGMARNTGMDAAAGKYVCFFDSDDYVLEHTIERLTEAIEKERAEIATFGFVRVSSDGAESSQFIPRPDKQTYRGSEVQEHFLPNLIAQDPKGDGTRLFYMSAWLMLYSVERIRQLGWRFATEREIISEDVYSLLNLFDGISSVTVVPEALYCYRSNDESLSRSYRADRYKRIKHFYIETMQLCRNKNYNQDVLHRVSKPYLGFTLAALKQEATAPLPFVQRKRNVYSIFKDPVLQQVLKDNKGDWASRSRNLVYFLLRRKCFFVCFLLFALKK